MTAEEIKRRHEKGTPMCILADLNNRSISEIRNIVNGLPPGHGEKVRNTVLYQILYDDGLSDDEIAKEVGVTSAAIRMWRMRKGLEPTGITPGQKWQMEADRLYMDGLTDQEIADALDKSPGGVGLWRYRNKYPPNSFRGRRRECIREARNE